MPIADILERGGLAAMTNQQIADLALAEDQSARRCKALGLLAEYEAHRAEADRLAALIGGDHASRA